jgi:hypothetical protein
LQAYPNPYFPEFYPNSNRTLAVEFIAVQDPASGLLQLQLADGSGEVWISELFEDEFATDTYAVAVSHTGVPSQCGAAGTSPGPAAGSGSEYAHKCETFVFSPAVDTSAAGVYDLLSEWISPAQTTAGQYNWLYNMDQGVIFQAAGNHSGFGDSSDEVSIILQFPF